MSLEPENWKVESELAHCHPLMSHSLLWMACQAWVAVPAITMEPGLSYPRHGLILASEFLAAYLGTLLIVLGIYLAVAPHLTQYTTNHKISLILAPLLITWAWNENYFYLLITMFLSLVDNTAHRFSRPPDTNIEAWAEECIGLQQNLRRRMNLPLLGNVSFLDSLSLNKFLEHKFT